MPIECSANMALAQMPIVSPKAWRKPKPTSYIQT